MKRITYSILSLAAVGVIGWSCSKSFLDKKPLGQLDANTLANKKGVEALLVGAYSVLDGFINGGGIFLGGWQSSAPTGYMVPLWAVTHTKDLMLVTNQTSFPLSLSLQRLPMAIMSRNGRLYTKG